MASIANVGNLSPSEWRELQFVLSRFERAWQGSGRADLGDFLAGHGPRLGPVVFLELVKSELEIRWRRGERPLVEEYLRHYPALGADPGLWAPLLAEEYRIRQQHADRPPLDEYRERFPVQFSSIARLIREQAAPPSLPPPPVPAPTAALGMPGCGEFLAGGGGYRLLEGLGSGSFGEVWRAEAPGGVPVAVKIIFRPLDSQEAQRELKSLDLIKTFNHPFLLKLNACWAANNRLHIAMELAESNLSRRLKASVAAGERGIPVAELLAYTRQAAEALDYAHARHVLHRDIKPDNILLTAGYVKVADFGLACLLDGAGASSATMCGTVPYMAPEVASGRTSARTDLYSLAATYVHLRHNRLLFAANNVFEMVLKHQNETPDLAEMAEAEREVLLHALAKDPDQRHPTCLEFALDLEKALRPLLDRPAERPAVPPAEPPDTAPSVHTLDLGTLGTVDGETPRSGVRVPATEPEESLPQPRAESQPAAEAPVTEPRTNGVPVAAPEPPRAPDRLRSVLLRCLVVPLVVAALLSPHRPPFVPHGLRPPDAARPVRLDDGQLVYDRLVYRLPDGEPVVFLLMTKEKNDPANLQPFYLMRNKVSNHVFHQVSQQHPEIAWGDEWLKGGRLEKTDLGVGNPDIDERPVFRVSVDTAHRFAQLLGGELPTPQQLDKAGGRFRGWEGPFQGARRLPVDQDPDFPVGFALGEPLPVHPPGPDRSDLQCENLASNGWEWTCCVAGAADDPDDHEDTPIPFDDPNKPVNVRVRGMSYLEDKPFLYGGPSNSLVRRDKRPRFRKPDDLPQHDVSFRVAIPIPLP
jgi:serine/threonine protein kinase/formylglycine-generating enzyme required for sulfatase activity